MVVCISPWNFPVAIFTGQIAAALAAGNAVIAKPAEETPLVAAEAVRLMHEAGAPADALTLLVGDGAVGAMLTAHAGVGGVMFTGSTEVARMIAGALAKRVGPDGAPIPLIAETGGQNALIVEFLSAARAGDRRRADVGLRFGRPALLGAARLVPAGRHRRPHAADAEVGDARARGRPADRLAADVGPVISADAQKSLNGYVEAMRARGFKVAAAQLGEACARGTFVAPTLIEIDSVADLGREVFGPVLHVLRFKRDALPALIDALNGAGYGLTGGVHSRIDSTVDLVASRLSAGNIYVNRNIIGAVVGVQPFGGRGLSGTGPKAGGPLYLKRLLVQAPADWPELPAVRPIAAALRFADFVAARGDEELAALCVRIAEASRCGRQSRIAGPGRRAQPLCARTARRRAVRRGERGGDARRDRLRPGDR